VFETSKPKKKFKLLLFQAVLVNELEISAPAVEISLHSAYPTHDALRSLIEAEMFFKSPPTELNILA
jgi:hypothetical protein